LLTRDPDPGLRMCLHQHNEENGTDLRNRVGLAEDTGAEISQTCDREQHSASGENGNVAAENQHRILPRDLMQNRKHEKHRAQQELVSDWIQILSEQCLLVECAGKQSVQAIAEAGNDEKNQS